MVAQIYNFLHKSSIIKKVKNRNVKKFQEKIRPMIYGNGVDIEEINEIFIQHAKKNGYY